MCAYMYAYTGELFMIVDDLSARVTTLTSQLAQREEAEAALRTQNGHTFSNDTY